MRARWSERLRTTAKKRAINGENNAVEERERKRELKRKGGRE